MNPKFSFKYKDAGTHPLSGQKLYGGIMTVEMPDGRMMQYQAGQHNSRQKLKDDFNRMMAGVDASSTGVARNVAQNYGSETTRVFPGDTTLSTKPYSTLSAPETYFTQTPNQDGTITAQEYSQQGIRQDKPLTYLYANMNDPNYNSQLDAIMDPVSGLPILQTLQGVYNPSTGFNAYNADVPNVSQGVGSITPLVYQNYLKELGLM